MPTVEITKRGSGKLLGLYISASMLVAANTGLPDGFFWTRFIISVLLAGIIAWRGFLEKPIDQSKETVELPEKD